MAVVERLGIHAAVEPADPDQGFDRSVSTFVLSPDDRTIYLLAEDQGHQKLYSTPAAGGSAREVGSLTAGTIGAFDVGGRGARADRCRNLGERRESAGARSD